MTHKVREPVSVETATIGGKSWIIFRHSVQQCRPAATNMKLVVHLRLAPQLGRMVLNVAAMLLVLVSILQMWA